MAILSSNVVTCRRTIGMAMTSSSPSSSSFSSFSSSAMVQQQARRLLGWWQFVRASCSSSSSSSASASWKDDDDGGGGGGDEENKNAYSILGLQRSCSAQSIRTAFRKLAKATHPDLQPPNSCGDGGAGAGAGAGARRSTSAQFLRVLAAYQILADPQKRAAYDAELQAAANRKEKTKYSIREEVQEQEQGQEQEQSDGTRGDLEVAEWLKNYQAVVRPQGLARGGRRGGRFQEHHLRGELQSALLKAFHGPQLVQGQERIPDCFEADERSGLGTDEILHLVSGRQLFGVVRQQQLYQPPALLQDLHPCTHPLLLDSDRLPSPTRTFDDLTTHSSSTADSSSSPSSHPQEDQLLHHSSKHGSAYVDLELHLFGKLVAKATRSRSNASNGYANGNRTQDYVSVFLTAAEELAAATAPPHAARDSKPPPPNQIADPWTVYATPGVDTKFLGTIHGLGTTKLGRVCAVYGPDGRRTHKIVQHQTPLVKHMWWFQEGGRCECRCRRASLPSSRFWIFAPRSTTHDVGGWYIETWEKEGQIPRSKTLGPWEHHEQRLHPAMFIMAVAYKTLDSETRGTHAPSLVSKIAKVKDTLTTFLKWWKTS